jgi:hypothetical protein
LVASLPKQQQQLSALNIHLEPSFTFAPESRCGMQPLEAATEFGASVSALAPPAGAAEQHKAEVSDRMHESLVDDHQQVQRPRQQWQLPVHAPPGTGQQPGAADGVQAAPWTPAEQLHTAAGIQLPDAAALDVTGPEVADPNQLCGQAGGGSQASGCSRNIMMTGTMSRSSSTGQPTSLLVTGNHDVVSQGGNSLEVLQNVGTRVQMLLKAISRQTSSNSSRQSSGLEADVAADTPASSSSFRRQQVDTCSHQNSNALTHQQVWMALAGTSGADDDNWQQSSIVPQQLPTCGKKGVDVAEEGDPSKHQSQQPHHQQQPGATSSGDPGQPLSATDGTVMWHQAEHGLAIRDSSNGTLLPSPPLSPDRLPPLQARWSCSQAGLVAACGELSNQQQQEVVVEGVQQQSHQQQERFELDESCQACPQQQEVPFQPEHQTSHLTTMQQQQQQQLSAGTCQAPQQPRPAGQQHHPDPQPHDALSTCDKLIAESVAIDMQQHVQRAATELQDNTSASASSMAASLADVGTTTLAANDKATVSASASEPQALVQLDQALLRLQIVRQSLKDDTSSLQALAPEAGGEACGQGLVRAQVFPAMNYENSSRHLLDDAALATEVENTSASDDSVLAPTKCWLKQISRRLVQASSSSSTCAPLAVPEQVQTRVALLCDGGQAKSAAAIAAVSNIAWGMTASPDNLQQGTLSTDSTACKLLSVPSPEMQQEGCRDTEHEVLDGAAALECTPSNQRLELEQEEKSHHPRLRAAPYALPLWEAPAVGSTHCSAASEALADQNAAACGKFSQPLGGGCEDVMVLMALAMKLDALGSLTCSSLGSPMQQQLVMCGHRAVGSHLPGTDWQNVRSVSIPRLGIRVSDPVVEPAVGGSSEVLAAAVACPGPAPALLSELNAPANMWPAMHNTVLQQVLGVGLEEVQAGGAKVGIFMHPLLGFNQQIVTG